MKLFLPFQPAIRNTYIVTTAFLLFLLVYIPAFSQAPDLILTHGKIFTSDTSNLYVEALAIQGNRIMAIGSTDLIEKLASRHTKTINLQGKTVVPGFNDAHDHLGWKVPVGQTFSAEFSIPGPGKQMVLDSVARLVKQAKPGQWISGDIGLRVLQDESVRKSLDSIAPNHPVALLVMWGHGMVVNSKALQLLGITENPQNPIGGWYERQRLTSALTGALHEYAQLPVWHALKISEPDKLVEGLRIYASQQVQLGITTVQDMSGTIPPGALKQIFSEANLSLRIRMIAFPGTSPLGRNLMDWKKVPPKPSANSYVSGVKYLIDETPLEGNALIKKQYPDKPGWYGRLNLPLDTIRQILKEALNSDLQLHMHIVGDSTLSLVLPLMKSMSSDAVWKTKRVRIEHNSTSSATETELKMIREMGIILAHTPQYGHNSPLRSLLSQGIPVAIAPDGLINPFVNIQIITSGQAKPEENITREQAVIAYTFGSAYAEFKEHEKGMLKKGMLADLAVLSQDIFTVHAPLLPATCSVLTIIDGKTVYASDEMKRMLEANKR